MRQPIVDEALFNKKELVNNIQQYAESKVKEAIEINDGLNKKKINKLKTEIGKLKEYIKELEKNTEEIELYQENKRLKQELKSVTAKYNVAKAQIAEASAFDGLDAKRYRNLCVKLRNENLELKKKIELHVKKG